MRIRLSGRGPPGLVGSAGDPEIDHGWDSFARYAELRIEADAQGALPHHRAEDFALALGRALRVSLGDRPRRRLGEATVPMEETLVQVVVDLADRPYYESDLDRRSMADHVLRSLAFEGRFTLHQRTIRPGEIHHLHEATFKALGRAWAAAAEPAARALSPKGRVRWRSRR